MKSSQTLNQFSIRFFRFIIDKSLAIFSISKVKYFQWLKIMKFKYNLLEDKSTKNNINHQSLQI